MRRAVPTLLVLLVLGTVAAPAAGYYRVTAHATARARVAVLPAPVLLGPAPAGNTGVVGEAAPAWRVSGAQTSLRLEQRDATGAWHAVGGASCAAAAADLTRVCTVDRDTAVPGTAVPGTDDTKGKASLGTQEPATGTVAYRARAVWRSWVSDPSGVVLRVITPTATSTPTPAPTGTVLGESTGGA